MMKIAKPVRLVLALSVAYGCAASSAVWAADAGLVKPALADDATDFCFFLWSDTHFDGASHQGLRNDAVNDMNRLQGKAMPAGYGPITPVAFVLHAGDVTTNARPEMWKNDDGRTEDDFISCIGRLSYPVFEVRGNHDADGGRTCVAEGITRRHGGLSYSFDCGGVHFVGLDMPKGHLEKGSPELTWLAEDLARVGPEKPVILLQHRPPKMDDGWNPFHDVIAPYHIVLICHGDSHRHHRYVWRGIDVWDAGHNDGRAVAWSSDPSTISVFRVEGNRLRGVHYLTVQDRWETTYMLDKDMTRRTVPSQAPAGETVKPR